MNKQTAVEWLLEKIEYKNGKHFTSYYLEFIEQAKAMEKEQIIDAYVAEMTTFLDEDAIEYYNEIYGKEI